MPFQNVIAKYAGHVLNTAGWLAPKITDPGNAGAISVGSSGICALVSAGAETRTIAAPLFLGQRITLIVDTSAGTIVVTASAGINQAGNNTMTMAQAADMIVLEAMQVAGALVWRAVTNDGVTLSTV